MFLTGKKHFRIKHKEAQLRERRNESGSRRQGIVISDGCVSESDWSRGKNFCGLKLLCNGPPNYLSYKKCLLIVNLKYITWHFVVLNWRFCVMCTQWWDYFGDRCSTVLGIVIFGLWKSKILMVKDNSFQITFTPMFFGGKSNHLPATVVSGGSNLARDIQGIHLKPDPIGPKLIKPIFLPAKVAYDYTKRNWPFSRLFFRPPIIKFLVGMGMMFLLMSCV